MRVFDWLDWLGLEADAEMYVDTPNNAPQTLLRHPVGVLTAEVRLRRLLGKLASTIALLSRQASPFSRGDLEQALLTAAARGVYDFDDALYLPEADSRWSHKSQMWQKAVKAAAVVIAGNDTLANRASELSPDVVVIPSCVDPDMYEHKQSYALGQIPRAVWIGSPSTEAYLRDIAAPLLCLHRSRGLRLTVISAGERPLGELDEMVDRVAWRLNTFAFELARADLGMMPLPDTPWTRGKCAYKLLQYGATGLPLVGSPVGMNRDVLHKGSGLAPTTTDEWIGALEQLLDESDAQRAQRGGSAREAVAESYSFEAWQGRWCKAVGVSID